MKTMRKTICAFCVCVMLTYIPCLAFAHPGKTDSNGGHTNHSTGEYHYHHGYEAHSHYDMDGDGDKDCPFEFKNNTNNSTSTNSGNKTSGSNNTNTGSGAKSSGSNSPKASKTDDNTGALVILGCIALFGSGFAGNATKHHKK